MQRNVSLIAVILACLTAASAATPNFSARHDYPGYFTTVANVADVNGDGIPDMVGLNPAHAIQVLLGNGDGTFRSGPTSESGMNLGGMNNVAIADVNGDGKPDAIIAGDLPKGPEGIGVCLGNGDGTFQSAVLSVGGKNITSIIAADFNGDGIPDVAAMGPDAIWVFIGNGDGTFQSPLTTTFSGDALRPMVAADLNGDGHLDLVAPIGTGFAVFLGSGNGTFQPEQDFNGAPGNVAVGDINQDGRPDVVVASDGSDYAHVYQVMAPEASPARFKFSSAKDHRRSLRLAM